MTVVEAAAFYLPTFLSGHKHCCRQEGDQRSKNSCLCGPEVVFTRWSCSFSPAHQPPVIRGEAKAPCGTSCHPALTISRHWLLAVLQSTWKRMVLGAKLEKPRPLPALTKISVVALVFCCLKRKAYCWYASLQGEGRALGVRYIVWSVWTCCLKWGWAEIMMLL